MIHVSKGRTARAASGNDHQRFGRSGPPHPIPSGTGGVLRRGCPQTPPPPPARGMVARLLFGINRGRRPACRRRSASAPDRARQGSSRHVHGRWRPWSGAFPDRPGDRGSSGRNRSVIGERIEGGLFRTAATFGHVELHDRATERHVLDDLVHRGLVVHRVDAVGIDADIELDSTSSRSASETRPVKVM